MNVKKILNALILGALVMCLGIASASASDHRLENDRLLAEMKQRANEYEPCKDSSLTPEQRFECRVAVDKKHPLPGQQEQMRYEQRLDELRGEKVRLVMFECIKKLQQEERTLQKKNECYSAADETIPKSTRQEAQADKYSRDASNKKKVEITRTTFLVLAALLILAMFIGFFKNIQWGGNFIWACGGIWISAVLSFQIYFLTLDNSSLPSFTSDQIFQGLLIWSLIATPGLLLLLGGRAVRKDAKFSADVNAMSYSRHNLNICVDQEKQIVMANGMSIPLVDFSYKTYPKTKKVSYNTGGNQTVYGSGGAVGTVYVPGESGSYEKHIGDVVDIKKKGEVVCSVQLALSSKSSFDALIGVLNNINNWRDKIAQKVIAKEQDRVAAEVKAVAIEASNAAQKSLAKLCDQAKLEKDFKNISCWNSSGMLTEAIAVDRSGKALAVYNKGASTWMGTLKGASAQIVGDKLELKVDDPAYREKHLTERRFSLLEKEPREMLVEWEDRINLLAKTAA